MSKNTSQKAFFSAVNKDNLMELPEFELLLKRQDLQAQDDFWPTAKHIRDNNIAPDQKFDASISMWHTAGLGSPFRTQLIEETYNTIDLLPQEKRYGAAMYVWHRIPNSSLLKDEALAKAFAAIPFLEEEKQRGAVQNVHYAAREGSPLQTKVEEYFKDKYGEEIIFTSFKRVERKIGTRPKIA